MSLSAAQAAARVVELVEAGCDVVLMAHLTPEGSRRRLVWVEAGEDPDTGPLEFQGELPRTDDLARDLLAGRRDEGEVEWGDGVLYAEVHRASPRLLIVGAGHIAQPLCTVGALLGFRVVVLDDRPDFATRERFPEADGVVRVDFADPFRRVPVTGADHLVLVTRGHKYDYECLRRLLLEPRGPRYIGMIGSRRRVRATFHQLVEEGIPRERLARVRAPLGLDLGAETPAEIAVAIAAEIVEHWRGGTGQPLVRKERILERFFQDAPSGPADPGLDPDPSSESTQE